MSDHSAFHSTKNTISNFNPVLNAYLTKVQDLLPGTPRSQAAATPISVPPRGIHAGMPFTEPGHSRPYRGREPRRRDATDPSQPSNSHQSNQGRKRRGRGRGRGRGRDAQSQSSAQLRLSAASSNQAVTSSEESNTTGSAVITESGHKHSTPSVAGRKRPLPHDVAETSEAKKRQLANDSKVPQSNTNETSSERPSSASAIRAVNSNLSPIHDANTSKEDRNTSTDTHNHAKVTAAEVAGTKCPLSEDAIGNSEDEKEEAKEDRTQATDDQCTGTLQYKADGYPTLHIECKDIDKLKEGEFLNDTILDFYLRYCINRHMLKTLHYMQTRLVDETYGYNYERVRRWFMKIDIFKKRYALMPVCLESHWFLAILINLQNCLGNEDLDASKEPRIYLLDSLGVNRAKEGRQIARYLECIAADRHPTERFRRPNVSNVRVPQQTNEYDCGIYVLHFAESFISSPARVLSAIKKKETTYWDTSTVSQKRSSIKKILKRI
ncbi:hypothetical protein VTP01DRAFT_10163 [Rhizomucor pusillus]|uniref:uncharacterized protein n=1 Tax=Rhizomucor pusillus TaxID=4840 RepID=UPI0037434C09